MREVKYCLGFIWYIFSSRSKGDLPSSGCIVIVEVQKILGVDKKKKKGILDLEVHVRLSFVLKTLRRECMPFKGEKKSFLRRLSETHCASIRPHFTCFY